MESNTLSGLLVDRTVANVEFALEPREMEIDAFDMSANAALSLVGLDLSRSRRREVALEAVLEGVCEAEAVKPQHLDCYERVRGCDQMSIAQHWGCKLSAGDIHSQDGSPRSFVAPVLQRPRHKVSAGVGR